MLTWLKEGSGTRKMLEGGASQRHTVLCAQYNLSNTWISFQVKDESQHHVRFLPQEDLRARAEEKQWGETLKNTDCPFCLRYIRSNYQLLSPVSLSVFSLIPDLLFDCSRVLEYAKIRTVLQSTYMRRSCLLVPDENIGNLIPPVDVGVVCTNRKAIVPNKIITTQAWNQATFSKELQQKNNLIQIILYFRTLKDI